MDKGTAYLGLHRTGNVTYTQYRGCGAGRDSYITVGNGGLVKPDAFINRPPQMGVQISAFKPRGFYHGPIKSYRGPLKEATVWRYYGDG